MSAATSPPFSDAARKDSVIVSEEQDLKIGFNHSFRGKDHVLETTTCASSGEPVLRPRKTKKDVGLVETFRIVIVNHQLGLAVNMLLLLAMTHALFPLLRSTTSKFFTLSYHNPKTGLYQTGADDFKYVFTWIVIFTGLRAGTMDNVLIPWARSVGIQKKKQRIRFAEQAWLIVFYSVFWSIGVYLYWNSAYFANLPAVWANYPSTSLTGLMKFYYLGQFAFWLQQIVVVNIEERRKDHWQMFTHHIITSVLLLTSYGYYQTRVGHVILMTMDIVDLVLPTAKMLKYAGYQTACDIAFGVFILTWFGTRHVFYNMICWSLYQDAPIVLPYGCYDTSTGVKLGTDGGIDILSNLMHAYNGKGPVCFNQRSRVLFLCLLLALQVILLVWFTMIMRVAYGVLSGKGADDSRSDDEDDEEEEEEEEERQPSAKKLGKRPSPTRGVKTLKEEEVGVEQLRFVKRTSPPARKARASGISIPGHSDKKELLGRIGCDKPS